MKRLPFLPRLMEATGDATVAPSAKVRTPGMTSSLLSETKATDRRVARIAQTLEMTMPVRLSQGSSSVDHHPTSTTSAEKCLATSTEMMRLT